MKMIIAEKAVMQEIVRLLANAWFYIKIRAYYANATGSYSIAVRELVEYKINQ